MGISNPPNLAVNFFSLLFSHQLLILLFTCVSIMTHSEVNHCCKMSDNTEYLKKKNRSCLASILLLFPYAAVRAGMSPVLSLARSPSLAQEGHLGTFVEEISSLSLSGWGDPSLYACVHTHTYITGIYFFINGIKLCTFVLAVSFYFLLLSLLLPFLLFSPAHNNMLFLPWLCGHLLLFHC